MKVSGEAWSCLWDRSNNIALLIALFAEKIRVGRDYQAVCPELVPPPERKPETVNDRALLVWSPTKEITDTKRESQGGSEKVEDGLGGRAIRSWE